jgi:predicted dehydrogenase
MDKIVQDFPPASRRLRLGFVGGGQGALIGEVHANGARLSNRWDIVAGALSSNPQRAKASGQAWMLDDDRIYND